MLVATKIRLYPNAGQREALARQFGCARFVWNWALALKKEAFAERHESLSVYVIKAMLPGWKEELPWLAEADSQVLQHSILNLGRAYENFFARRAGYPKAKSKHGEQSIQYPQRVKVEGGRICLPKVGEVKAVVHRAIEGTIKTVTISQSATGKYYAAVLGEDAAAAPSPLVHLDTVSGVDCGITDCIVTSDGDKSGNPRFLKRAQATLRRRQKSLSRKVKGSHNRAQARQRLALAHERVAAARADWQHKVSRALADENQAVVMETLKVKNMLKNHPLARAIADAGWQGLTLKVKYKLERKGGHFVALDPFFASSKSCSCCDHKLATLALSQRFWQCPKCGTVHDRDINAAVNIKKQGIVQLQAAGLTVSAHGGLRKPSVALAAA